MRCDRKKNPQLPFLTVEDNLSNLAGLKKISSLTTCLGRVSLFKVEAYNNETFFANPHRLTMTDEGFISHQVCKGFPPIFSV